MRKSIKLPLPGVPTMLVAGQILRNRYEIVKVLGSGGFAETYLANDLDIPITPKPKCVVKRLHPQAIEPDIQRLFQKEAEILYKLAQNHERIPKLFAYFEENQEFYLIQEFIEGHDLSKELSPGKKLSETYAIKLLQDILEILAYVHQNNIIHRDIKPQNIMRRKDGKLMLIDFGAVKEIGIQKTILSGKTSRTVSIGTLGFMPSEQAMGKPKPSSDIYALGRTVIFALTGVEPDLLEEDNDGEVIWKNYASVSDGLADILSKMVRDHFTGRYANATEALQALNSLVSGSALPTAPPQTKTIISPPVLPTPSVPSQASTVIAAPILPTYPFQFMTVTVNARGKIVNRQQGQADVFTEKLSNNVSLEMVSIKGGRFLMGSPETEEGRYGYESPQHRVTVQPFFLGKYPVTQAQWQSVMGNNPANSKGNNRPVENVSWNDAVEFCQKLSQKTGRNYRLPSEAEWEYACRAGITTPFYFGETITPDLANYDGIYIYASGPQGQCRKQTTDVGSFPPNAFGLYDMHGNVWEWCQDVWHENYNGAPSDGSAWEIGGDSKYRLRRGGSWNLNPAYCRSALRIRYGPNFRNYHFGFRVALVPAAISAPVLPTPSVPSQQTTVIAASALPTSSFEFTTVTVDAQGKIVNSQQRQAEVFAEKLGNNVILEMVSIPGGTFLMGSPNTEVGRFSSESPQHWVTLQPFLLGKYPITQAQWQAVMGNNPAKFKGNNRPVENVFWNDVVEFCQKLSEKTGRNYRLPSEAEWEYACRAGTTTPFYFGETITPFLVNYDGNATYASVPKGVNRKQTTDVGSFPPNAFGLYDMHGNVWEWCQDVWHENYNNATSDGSAWESGGDSNFRLQRGGSWKNYPRYCRSANRGDLMSVFSYNFVGFRVALDPMRAI
ncbi:bifunctional serine/threonine-protein kinase/formylglycine-generating enzyme family protein [Microcoleus sp. FACHB-68]|uniref:bifunctional serine/threonine-protein kinase/formylglycine-generating enzyme family protein n=1 Tax=Microcoleus sp. FACHB-68 TaxID=2692826 RepID=UPI001F54A7C4|nr:bifunctional serine/threonine-protein kinase/formylglycine-generating enzyme family protein [Microcoleus sp. FACHB-68]